MSISQNFTYNCYFIDISARYSYTYTYTYMGTQFIDEPEDPHDAAALSWLADDWDLLDRHDFGKSTGTSDYTYWSDGSYSEGDDGLSGECDTDTEGSIGYGFDAFGACNNDPNGEPDQNNWSPWEYGGAYLKVDCEGELSSEVHGQYIRAYNADGIVTSVGASYPWGISASFSNDSETKEEVTQTQEDSTKALYVSLDMA